MEWRTGPPKATSKPPQSLLIARGLRPQSHPKATPMRPQSHLNATLKLPQSHHQLETVGTGAMLKGPGFAGALLLRSVTWARKIQSGRGASGS